MNKRIVAALLAVVLVVCMMPAMALALDVADLTGLQNAFTAGGTITLANNITVSQDSGDLLTVPAGVSVELDLNGQTISYTLTAKMSKNTSLINVKNGATLTIKDSVGGGKISFTHQGSTSAWGKSGAVISNNQGHVIIESGIIEDAAPAFDDQMSYAIDTLTNGGIGDAILEIKGGSLSSNYRAIRQFANSSTKKNEVIITGGSITGQLWMQSANSSQNIASTEISGGTISGNGRNDNRAIYIQAEASEAVDVSISAGKVNGGVTVSQTDGTPAIEEFITGGDFSNSNVFADSNLIAPGTTAGGGFIPTVIAPPAPLIPQVNVPIYRLPEYIEAEEVVEAPEVVQPEEEPEEGDVAENTPDEELPEEPAEDIVEEDIVEDIVEDVVAPVTGDASSIALFALCALLMAAAAAAALKKAR